MPGGEPEAKRPRLDTAVDIAAPGMKTAEEWLRVHPVRNIFCIYLLSRYSILGTDDCRCEGATGCRQGPMAAPRTDSQSTNFAQRYN